MAILTPSNSKVAGAYRDLANARDILSEKAGKDGAYKEIVQYVETRTAG